MSNYIDPITGLPSNNQYDPTSAYIPLPADTMYKPAETYVMPTLPESQGLGTALPENQSPDYKPSLFDGQLGKNILGNTMQDGFQAGDIVSWGRNLFGAADNSIANFRGTNMAKSLGLGSATEGEDSELSDANKFNGLWGGLQSLNNIYQGHKFMQMKKQQHEMQMDMWNKSWDANKKAVNEAVDHRANSKYGYDPEKVAKHKKEYSV